MGKIITIVASIRPMIKRESLKHAIDAISERDPEVGYSLTDMFGTGRIDAPDHQGEDNGGDNLYFLFEDQKVPIKKISFFNDGTAVIEQHLLIKYGERLRKQVLSGNATPLDYREAALDIYRSGLQFMVIHEIKFSIQRLKKQLAYTNQVQKKKALFLKQLISFLEDIRAGDSCVDDFISRKMDENHRGVFYTAEVSSGIKAHFIQFPYCLDALMQVAHIDLEFFHVRFLLRCLEKKHEKNLFACIVKNNIMGLIYLSLKEQLLYKGLEVRYVATLRNTNRYPDNRKSANLKGIGTFLMAGIWMLWKQRLPSVKEIFLDSEIGAGRFYSSIGFTPRRLCAYSLKKPAGYLMKTILIMADNCREPGTRVIQDLCRLIEQQVKILAKKPRRQQAENRQRQYAIEFIKACLLSKRHLAFPKTAAEYLLKKKANIPETEHLLSFGTEKGRIKIKPPPIVRPVLVIKDERFSHHLENVFHIESAKRNRAVEKILAHKSLHEKWAVIPARMATVEQLAWIHTPEHIERIARTAGKSLRSFDLDTQTTARSYDTARLAVGSLFSLIDGIWRGDSDRGFAFLRPPGHHAEPDKVMGFCLFNNVALGAGYLKKEYAVKKVMIVDIDVHHGNGTQAAFYDTDDVLFVSMHQFPCYPGTGKLGEVGSGKGEGFTVNIPLAKGHGDRDFAQIVIDLIAPLADSYCPEFMLVSCGFDLYLHDRLGGMKGTPEGYALITRLLLEIAERVCSGKIAFVMEGGYSVQGIEKCGLSMMKELCNAGTLLPEKIAKIKESRRRLPILEKVIEVQSRYWDNFR